MGEEQFHFQVGHFCAGCPVGEKLHRGCVVEGNVVVKNGAPASVPQAGEERVALEVTTPVSNMQPLFQS